MADEAPSATDETPAEETELGDAGKAALDKERQARREAERKAKENADAAKRLAELEDAQKTETEKLNSKVSTLAGENETLALANARLRVAIRHGLTEDQSRRLIGADEEELEADAQVLLKTLSPPLQEESPSPSRPRENLRTGAQPATPGLGDDALTQTLKRKLGINS